MAKKLTGVYLDDDPFILQVIQDLSKRSPLLEITTTYSNERSFLEDLPKLDCDTYLLDIVMPDLGGLIVANSLKGKPFMFVTSASEILPEALALNPVDILTKPVTLGRFNQAAEKALQYYEYKNKNRQHIFHIAGKREQIKITLDDIMVVLTDGNEYRIKEIIMKDGKIFKVTGHTLDDFLAMAPKPIQINIGELVSSDAVESFSHDTICLKELVINGKTRTLTLARTFRRNFMDNINL